MRNNTLGERIKEARLEKKLTQKEVSGDFITRNMLSQIENGLAYPSIKTIEYLAKKLDKPITYFMDAMVEEDLTSDNKVYELDKLIELYLVNDWDKCIKGLEKIDDENNFSNYREFCLLMYHCLANKGFELFSENKFIETEEILRKSLMYQKKIPYNNKYLETKILMYLTQVSLKLGKLNQAEKYNGLYEETIHLFKEIGVKDFFVKSEILFQKKMYEQIIELSDNTCYSDIKYSGDYYYLLGRVFYELDKIDDAINSFLKCSEKWKDTEKPLISLNKYIADCYSKIGNYEKAYEFLKKNS